MRIWALLTAAWLLLGAVLLAASIGIAILISRGQIRF